MDGWINYKRVVALLVFWIQTPNPLDLFHIYIWEIVCKKMLKKERSVPKGHWMNILSVTFIFIIFLPPVESFSISLRLPAGERRDIRRASPPRGEPGSFMVFN